MRPRVELECGWRNQAKSRWLAGLRKLPGGGGFAVGVVMVWWNQPESVKHGPLDAWLYDSDIVARRIARMADSPHGGAALCGGYGPRAGLAA